MSTPAVHPILQDIRALAHRTWWVFLIGGIASVVFGVIAFARPGLGLFVLATFFAAGILVDGVSTVVGAVQHREKDGWWLLLLLGLISALVGAYLLVNTPLSMLAFAYVVGFQALAAGVFLVALGWKIRQRATHEWILYVLGALSMLFGLSLFVTPLAASVSLVLFLATWSIISGLLRIMFAMRVRSLAAGVRDRIADARA